MEHWINANFDIIFIQQQKVWILSSSISRKISSYQQINSILCLTDLKNGHQILKTCNITNLHLQDLSISKKAILEF